MEARMGAKRTLRRFRPVLAVCVSHSLDHWYAIPKWIASLNSGHRFYLGHGSCHGDDTVLSADARNIIS